MDQPPPPPPKPDSDSISRLPVNNAPPDNRASIIPISPGISSAVNFMRLGEEQKEREDALERERERGREKEREREREREKERDRRREVEQEKEREMEREKERERQREEEKRNLARQEQEAKVNLARQEADRDKTTEKPEENGKNDAADKGDMKDVWRKSDSTISHVTIRPGAGNSRPSRPVSMADSLQSNHTIVPVNKRLSALISDADFGMPEEDDSARSMMEDEGGEHRHNRIISDSDLINSLSIADPHRSSPTASLKSRHNRRSMSLNITSHSSFAKPELPPTSSSASAADLRTPSQSISEGMQVPPAMAPSLSRDSPTLSGTSATATGFIGASSSGPHSTGHNIRGRLAAWTTVGHSSSASSAQPPPPPPLSTSRQERSLPALPQQPLQQHSNPQQHPHPQQFNYAQLYQHQQPPLPAQHTTSTGPSLRQTAISMTSGFAPAAGLAKRAVEKMGRALGGMSSGSSNNGGHGHSHSEYPSSSSGGTGTGPSSYPSSGHHSYHHHRLPSNAPIPQDSGQNVVFGFTGPVYDLSLGRTNSNQSSSGGHHQHVEKKGRLRRTPDAPSGSSVKTSSSISISDSEAFAGPSGPVLGKRLRGPLRAKSGVVFRRDLKSVVRETGVGVGKPKGWGGRWRNWDDDADREGMEDADARKRILARSEQLKALEERKLPALAVRCAQHLLIWGIQEEGLFRWVFHAI
jgi:hypothetical protein